MKKCPYCAEQIQDEAILCRYCGKEFTATSEFHQSSASKSKKGRNSLGSALVVIGALLGLLYALSIVASEWGLVGAAAAFMLFPVAIAVAPIYALIVYGAWLPILIVYGLIGLGVYFQSTGSD